MYRIERFLKVFEMGVQNCVSFVDLFKYIPESRNIGCDSACILNHLEFAFLVSGLFFHRHKLKQCPGCL